MRTHKERVAGIKDFAEKNKLFMIFACIAVIWLLGNSLFSKEPLEPNDQTAEAVQTETAEADNLPEWQFYPIDAGILLVGGGFCVVMIIREKKRAKEELQ